MPNLEVISIFSYRAELYKCIFQRFSTIGLLFFYKLLQINPFDKFGEIMKQNLKVIQNNSISHNIFILSRECIYIVTRVCLIRHGDVSRQ